MKKFIFVLVSVAVTGFGAVAGEVAASGMPEMWPSCSGAAAVSCVESLAYETPSGVVTVAKPGAPGMGEAASEPYVSVTSTEMSTPNGAVGMLNFSVVNPADPVMGPGVYGGLEDGTYTIVLRLGNLDPSFTGLAADPVSVTPEKNQDGTFKLTLVGKPKPFVSVMNNYNQCVSGNWACEGEVGVQRNISGFVTTIPMPQYRDALRGAWVATNASSFSTPQFSITERKMTASAAGPHTVPAGYPTAGLVMEDGKGLNPAFYKAFLPISVLQLMLEQAPEEIKSYITPETVRAKITEMGAEKDQAVSVTVSEKGVTLDLGLTHFSAPNPEITFLKKTTGTAPAAPAAPGAAPAAGNGGAVTSPGSSKVSVGKRFAPSSYVKVPAGYRVVSVAVKSSSKNTCIPQGKNVVAKKKGKCYFTTTVSKGKTKKVLSGSVTIG